MMQICLRAVRTLNFGYAYFVECVFKIKSILLIIFYTIFWTLLFQLIFFSFMFLRIFILHLIISIKSKVWIITHCLVLGMKQHYALTRDTHTHTPTHTHTISSAVFRTREHTFSRKQCWYFIMWIDIKSTIETWICRQSNVDFHMKTDC